MSIVAKRFAIKYEPATILLEYTKNNKLRRRKMPIRDITKKTTSSQVVEQLMKKHPLHLSPKVVSRAQLTKLVSKILDKHNSAAMKKGLISTSSLSTSSKSGGSSASGSLITEDLNKVSPEELVAAKAKMNETFEKNRAKPGDPSFVYDKRVDFVSSTTSEWDDDADDFDMDDEEDDLYI